MKKVILVSSLMSLVLSASAKIEMGTPFSDGAILQRGMKVPVWGKVTPPPGKSQRTIEVSFGGQEKTATVEPLTGCWKVELDPMEASKESRAIKVRELIPGILFDDVEDSLEVKDILVGEVWFASGQSNMDCPIWVGGHSRYRDGKGAMMCAMANQPYVRYCRSPKAWSVTPAPVKARWSKLVSATISKDALSAVAFYFARELYLALDVPVGIIDASWGGTNIDAWTPRCGYEGCDPTIAETAAYPVKKDWDATKDKAGPIGGAHQQPTVLFNGMVAAWTPMAMRGFIWYQGCHNAGQAKTYCAKMHALYNGWSRAFGNPELKLYFAELAPYSSNWNAIVAQQVKFAAEERNAAISVLSDVGNFHDIHPNDKETVAQRLVVHALRRDYGLPIAEDDSPVCKVVEPQADGTLKVAFDHAESLYVYHPDFKQSAPFEVAGTNGVWQAADIVNYRQKPKTGWADTFVIDVPYVILRSEKVAAPVKVRYMGQARTAGTLYNQASLPLGPFEAEKR